MGLSFLLLLVSAIAETEGAAGAVSPQLNFVAAKLAQVMEQNAETEGIRDCWNALTQIPGCVPELIGSYISRRIAIRYVCCLRLGAIGQQCFDSIFSSFPFYQKFERGVKKFCHLR
ncbi:hypothetical protein HPP92_020615 [Vanilla planifolia]|nr:hypothetical protein HPP92_020615 [Vanilla planifolia]